MKKRFKLQFKKWHLIVLLVCLCMTSIALILESKIKTHALDVNTHFEITAGALTFYKDTSTTMDSYFGYSPDTGTSIDIGNHQASLLPVDTSSPDKQRFTISDMLGSSFVVTIQTSPLVSSGGEHIPASNIGYTGTVWLGTGKALTAAPTNALDIGTIPVTFVARQNEDGLSMFSQEISLKVKIPAAQKPGSYTGTITFTY